jgi:exopolysaccharide biosynthesis polyprenyl glycosylphosphotransferase
MTESSPALPLNNRHFLSPKAIVIFFIVVVDIALAVFSDLSAFTLRYGTDISNPPPENFLAYLKIAVLAIFLRICCLYIYGLYHNLRAKTVFNIIVSVFQATLTSSVIIVVSAFYFRAFAYPRTVIFISWALTTSLLIVWHIVIQTVIDLIAKSPANNLIVIGTDKQAYRLGLDLSKDGSTKYNLIGFVHPEARFDSADFEEPQRILGPLNDLERIVGEHSVDEIIIATETLSRRQISAIFASLAEKKISLKLLPDIYEAVIGNIIVSSDGFGGRLPDIVISPVQISRNWYVGLKRILDLILSIIILLLFSPLILIIAVLIELTSPGPAIFKQERVGLNGNTFWMYKFRTMYKDAEQDRGPVWAALNDPRITPLGKALRLSRLDELPQLVNVLKNEMSVVGPRPERPYFMAQLIKEIPFYAERLSVKPGITGWAQVTYKYADTLETNKEKLLADLFYIKNMSLSLDVWIFFMTVWTIIKEKGAQ